MAQQNIIWHKKNILVFASLLLFLFILLSVGLSLGLRQLVKTPSASTTIRASSTAGPATTTTIASTTQVCLSGWSYHGGKVRLYLKLCLMSIIHLIVSATSCTEISRPTNWPSTSVSVPEATPSPTFPQPRSTPSSPPLLARRRPGLV